MKTFHVIATKNEAISDAYSGRDWINFIELAEFENASDAIFRYSTVPAYSIHLRYSLWPGLSIMIIT